MTDPTSPVGDGVDAPRRPDPAARRAQLDALRASRPAAGADPAPPQRRHPSRGHAALASRVLVTGLAAGTTVGLVGLLAQADARTTQASATTTSTTTPVQGYGPFGAVGYLGASTMHAGTGRATVVTTTSTTLPPTTAPAPGAAPAGASPAPSSSAPTGSPSAGSAPVAAPPVTAPPVTAPPVTAPPVTAPPVTAPPATTPPASGTGGS